MKTNQLFQETSARTFEELERQAYMAGDIQAAELYALANDPPVSERVKELTMDLQDADQTIEDLRQELDEMKRFAYQVANLDHKNYNDVLRAIQRAGALL
jgi:hypothetical protein